MPFCTTCSTYYRQSPYNNTCECDICVAHSDDEHFDVGDYAVDVENITNPSHKTKVFRYDYDDTDDQS